MINTMKIFTSLILLFSSLSLFAQNAMIKGAIQDPEERPVLFANIALYSATDSSLVKVETSDEEGVFTIQQLNPGNYYLIVTYVGMNDLKVPAFDLKEGQTLDLAILKFDDASVELSEVTVTAQRAMVEVKPDRTVFNVQGTINSTGSDGINLLRKAPGVMVDNNNNITVLGRTGVLVYIDGKRLPLTGEDLAIYLQNLPAEQIDRIDIITNPGAKYEAEGNAGIIDIRLKRDENLGYNGSLSTTFSQGRYARSNTSGTINYRTKKFNIFGAGGYGDGKSYNNISFESRQNGLELDEINNFVNEWKNFNLRGGMDYYINDKNIIGVMISGNFTDGNGSSVNRIKIADQKTPTQLDSILIADSETTSDRNQQTYNINYRYTNKETTLNIDADFGRYETDQTRYQPNLYFNREGGDLLTSIVNSFDTPTDIDIYTFKADYEQKFFGGKLGLGTKFSKVVSDNTFLFFDEPNGEQVRNDRLSNQFKYDENVYAGYFNYARPLGKQFNLSAGLRVEQTDATGDLTPFDLSLEEPPVELNYLSWFPSAGLSWQMARMHNLSLNYGRRINRPDYNVLNPFNNQLSQLSFERGNPRLQPEIVNNIELGYTYAYRYNFKIGYSKTNNQITRLIGPDENDPRASFISWDNLAEQTIYSASLSAPVQIKKWWNAYFNASAGYTDNQADYGDGAVVDVQAFSYSIYQQHTFNLFWNLKGEISGYFSGPGVWGGVFEYDESWSLNLGLQRKFMNDRLNVRISASDLFYETGWEGVSEFNGLVSEGFGNWDSRRVSLSLSFNFGNDKVKSRKRKTGLEDEAGRVGE